MRETKIRSMKFLPRFKSSKFVDTFDIFADVNDVRIPSGLGDFWGSKILSGR